MYFFTTIVIFYKYPMRIEKSNTVALIKQKNKLQPISDSLYINVIYIISIGYKQGTLKSVSCVFRFILLTSPLSYVRNWIDFIKLIALKEAIKLKENGVHQTLNHNTLIDVLREIENQLSSFKTKLF